MSEFLNHISIVNFKSIKSCDLFGCGRINLFIGRPNVGKSNIIEALSLFSLPYLRENTSKKISNLIRLENEPELFFNGNTAEEVTVKANDHVCQLGYGNKEGLTVSLHFNGSENLAKPISGAKGRKFDHIKVDDKLTVRGMTSLSGFESPIKKYTYKTGVNYKRSHLRYLVPPFGFNLLSIIEAYSDLKKDVTQLFEQYRLSVAFDKSSQTLKVIQDKTDSDLFLIPYNSIADTLQRVIFYKTAIASNDNNVLLFEEPEAHSFPPYMTHITQEMIHKNDNQYFITTHSPFILNDLLENATDELAVFIVYYEQYETKVKKLSEGQLREIYQDGVDLFTNSESFV